jgi:internalin A
MEELAALGALPALEAFMAGGILLDVAPSSKPVCLWPNLRFLEADKLTSAPSELASDPSTSNPLPQIRAWQQDLLLGEAANSTVKIFLLGNGRAGKTQIRRRIFGLPFDPSIPSTHGIELADLTVAAEAADYPEITAKVWDFGGQSIYMGTHGLFLDDRAIYVIAWTPCLEAPGEIEENGIRMWNRPLTYWLEFVRSIAGPAAPVIVTQTQCDRELDVKHPTLPANLGFDRLRVIDSSARREDGVEKLFVELKSAAKYLFEKYKKVRLPLSWCAIAKDLEKMRQQGLRTVSYQEFEKLCRTKYHAAAPEAVLQYLHRSGQAFYHAGAFGNCILLDLDWALAGIYAVMDRQKTLPLIQQQGGRFSLGLLSVLIWQQYPPADRELFLSLMQQCRICFKVAENQYIAPNALPGESHAEKDIAAIWRNAQPTAMVRLDYAFLHEGVLRAVLCTLGEKAGEHAAYWAYGICFYDSNTKAVARIRSEFADPAGTDPRGTITVEAHGVQAGELVENLITMILRVNIGAKPELTWGMGQPGKGPAEAEKEPAAITPAAPPREPDSPHPVYISYAWGGSDALVEEFERKLPATHRSMRDKRTLQLGERISRFMREIGNADCVLVVIDEKYLRSTYCMRELLHIYERSLGEDQAFLNRTVPLIRSGSSFSQFKERAPIIQYWQEKDRAGREALASIDPLNVGIGDREELHATELISRRVSEILYWFADTLMPRGPEAGVGIDAAIRLIVERTRKFGEAR